MRAKCGQTIKQMLGSDWLENAPKQQSSDFTASCKVYINADMLSILLEEFTQRLV